MTDVDKVRLYTNLPFLASELIDVAKLFMHGELFEYTSNITQANIIHILTCENDAIIKNQCQYKNKTYCNTFTLSKQWDKLELKRFIKRYAKLAAYHCLKQVFDKQMPWGALTGIRPTKLAYEFLAENLDFKEMFKNVFDVSDKKITVVERILKAQQGFRYFDDKVVNFYVGIPFCTSRCSYCSFTAGEIKKLNNFIQPYLTALNMEIKETLNLIEESGKKVKNIYFGGGTPTSIPLSELDRLLAHFDNIKADEFTVEAGRPDTITEQTLQVLKSHAVNRISINPQSFNQRVLDIVGRKHTVKDIVDKLVLAKRYDFIVNMDFIAGLPTETFAEFKNSIDKAISLIPDNITVHTLALKKGSELKQSNVPAAYDGAVSDMVDYSYQMLTTRGYEPYYLYRQKYMTDNLENIGYAKSGTLSKYNIDIMEETTSILACGSNAITKRVFSTGNRIERAAAPKDLSTYINKIDDLIKNKKQLFIFE